MYIERDYVYIHMYIYIYIYICQGVGSWVGVAPKGFRICLKWQRRSSILYIKCVQYIYIYIYIYI